MLKRTPGDRFELPVIDGPTAAPTAAPKPKARTARKPKTAPAPKPAAEPVAAHPPASRFKFNLTIALGVFIPVMSLATSKVAGTLAGHGHYGLAAFGALIGVAVLAVSLSHLAWAVRDVTGSGPRASWAMALALDCSLVLCELVHVTAADAGLDAVCWAVMAVVAGFSMVLNCHAFLNHKAA
jgi:hypothetical protein